MVKETLQVIAYVRAVIILGMVPGEFPPEIWNSPPEILTIVFWPCDIPVM